jgi:hypothetical protein
LCRRIFVGNVSNPIKDAVTGNTKVITVQVTNLYSASQLDNIEKMLKKIAGVESVQRRNFSAAGTATLDAASPFISYRSEGNLSGFPRVTSSPF